MFSDSAAIGRKPHVVAVGGGKGGSGKSFIVANLGVCLSKRGQRVIMVDTDLGGANLHTLVGVTQPPATLDDFIERRVESFRDVIAKTAVPNLGLVTGIRDSMVAANPRVHQKLRTIRHILSLDSDYVVIDLGAGSSFNVLDFFLISDDGIIVVTPEPTSVENAYRFIKNAFFRKVRKLTLDEDGRRIVQAAMDRRDGRGRGVRTPIDLVEVVGSMDSEMGQVLRREIERFRPKLIINQVRTKGDVDVGYAMRSSCSRVFGVSLNYFGYVAYDSEVWQSVQRKTPIVLERPYAKASRCITEIASRLLKDEQLRFDFWR